MKNTQKLIFALLLGALSVSSTLPADYQIISSKAPSSIITRDWINNPDQQTPDPHNKQTTEPLETLLNNPLTSLQDLGRVKNQFVSDLNTKKLNDCSHSDTKALEELVALIQLHEKMSPIFLLGECEFKTCLLSRIREPKHRDLFENRVVEALVDKLTHRNEPVQYVGFGSGGMYTDLVILCKALTKALTLKPNVSIALHLIDPQYKFFDTVRNEMTLDNQVNANINTPNQINEFLESLSTQYGDKTGKVFQVLYTKDDCTARQLLTFLQKSFPDAQLTLHLHRDRETYLDYIRKDASPLYPDVICAVDIGDGSPKSFQDYAHLVSLQDTDANNMLLLKGRVGKKKSDNVTAQFGTCSLDEGKKGIKEKLSNNPTVYLYAEDL